MNDEKLNITSVEADNLIDSTTKEDFNKFLEKDGSDVQEQRQCRRKTCRQFKPISDFYKGASIEGGLHMNCISCRKEHHINYYRIAKERKKINPPTIDESTLKQCSRKDCLQFKPLSCFAKGILYKDGHKSWCKDCDQKYVKAWRIKQSELSPKPKRFPKEKKIRVKKTIEIIPLDPSKLRQCQRNTCEEFKHLSEFGVSMSHPDGYSPICKDCVLRAMLKGAIQGELAKRARDNYVLPADIILHPIPFNDFLELNLLHPHHQISEYFYGVKTTNDYVSPAEHEHILTDEYCHGEPPSSFRDFIIEATPVRYLMTLDGNGNYISEELMQEEIEDEVITIMESRKEKKSAMRKVA